MSVIGGRKFTLGLLYIILGFATILTAVFEAPEHIAAVAAGCVSLAPGVGAIIWGNVQEHRTKNGGGP